MPIPVAEQVRYGSLGSIVALGGFPLYLYAPDFYASQRGVDLALIGSTLLILRLLDGLTDPLWGWLSDRYIALRQPLYALFALFFLVGLWALFSPPDNAGIVWFFVTVLLASAGYSYLTILLNSMASWRADNERDAIALTTAREAWVMIGLMLAALGPPLMTQAFGAEAGYRWFALAFALSALALMLYWGGWLRQQPHRSIEVSGFDWRNLAGFLPVLGAARTTYLVYSLSALAAACPAVLFVFFVRDYLQAEAWIGLFLFIYFVTGVAGMPLWRFVSDRVGIDRAWLLCMVFSILAFVAVLFVKPGDLLLFGFICAATGLAFGGDQSLPSARLVGDLARNDLRYDSSRAFALMAFMSKLVLALSAAVLLWMLDAAGFQPASDNNPGQLDMLLLGYGGIPLVLKSIVTILLFTHLKHRGTREDENNRWKNTNCVGTAHDR